MCMCVSEYVCLLTIVGIVEINYFAPAVKLYCINDGLMIIRAHAEGKVEEARRWRKHLKRENYGKQRSYSVAKRDSKNESKAERQGKIVREGETESELTWDKLVNMNHY